MKRSTERILTTHAGSLPRPPDLTRMMWDLLEERPVDQAKLAVRVQEAVVETVGKQREAGIDIISDGEMSKVGFSNYVMQRYSGFANRAQFVATDLVQNVSNAAGWHSQIEREPVCAEVARLQLTFQETARMCRERHDLTPMIIDDLDIVRIAPSELRATA